MTALAALDNALQRLYSVCGVLAGGFIVLIAVLVAVNIVSRLIGTFVPGLTETAGYAMAAAGALGLAYTFGDNGHIRVTLILDLVRGRGRFYLELWALGAAACLIGYLAYYLVRMVYISWLFEDRSDGSDALLIWIPQVPLAFGAVVFAICLVHAWIKAVAAGRIEDDDRSAPAAGH